MYQYHRPEKNSDLEFCFPSDLIWEELDKQGSKLPKGMSLVDLVIERENEVILVEIKDPSNINAPEKERKRFIEKLRKDHLINEELVPKGRDSYTFIHLMLRDNKPINYVVLLGLDRCYPLDLGLPMNLKDRLRARLENEGDSPWRRKHIKDCAILTVPGWNKKYQDWPVKRLSEEKT